MSISNLTENDNAFALNKTNGIEERQKTQVRYKNFIKKKDNFSIAHNRPKIRLPLCQLKLYSILSSELWSSLNMQSVFPLFATNSTNFLGTGDSRHVWIELIEYVHSFCPIDKILFFCIVDSRYSESSQQTLCVSLNLEKVYRTPIEFSGDLIHLSSIHDKKIAMIIGLHNLIGIQPKYLGKIGKLIRDRNRIDFENKCFQKC